MEYIASIYHEPTINVYFEESSKLVGLVVTHVPFFVFFADYKNRVRAL